MREESCDEILSDSTAQNGGASWTLQRRRNRVRLTCTSSERAGYPHAFILLALQIYEFVLDTKPPKTECGNAPKGGQQTDPLPHEETVQRHADVPKSLVCSSTNAGMRFPGTPRQVSRKNGTRQWTASYADSRKFFSVHGLPVRSNQRCAYRK